MIFHFICECAVIDISKVNEVLVSGFLTWQPSYTCEINETSKNLGFFNLFVYIFLIWLPYCSQQEDFSQFVALF